MYLNVDLNTTRNANNALARGMKTTDKWLDSCISLPYLRFEVNITSIGYSSVALNPKICC